MRVAINVICFWATLALALSGCEDLQSLGWDFPEDSPTQKPSSNPTSKPMAQEILDLTNAYRASNGVRPLTLNANLDAAAQAHADAMLTLGFFDHNSLDGTGPGTRIRNAGYSWSTWGENIAYGYSTAEAVMQGWINSSGHRANILNGNFKELGVGYAAQGTAYWVQDFGAK